jgi:hypothetical protein
MKILGTERGDMIAGVCWRLGMVCGVASSGGGKCGALFWNAKARSGETSFTINVVVKSARKVLKSEGLYNASRYRRKHA